MKFNLAKSQKMWRSFAYANISGKISDTTLGCHSNANWHHLQGVSPLSIKGEGKTLPKVALPLGTAAFGSGAAILYGIHRNVWSLPFFGYFQVTVWSLTWFLDATMWKTTLGMVGESIKEILGSCYGVFLLCSSLWFFDIALGKRDLGSNWSLSYLFFPYVVRIILFALNSFSSIVIKYSCFHWINILLDLSIGF